MIDDTSLFLLLLVVPITIFVMGFAVGQWHGQYAGWAACQEFHEDLAAKAAKRRQAS